MSELCTHAFFFLVHKYIHFLVIKTDFDLSEDETCRATIRMFVDFNLVGQFHIPYDVSIACKNYVEIMSKMRKIFSFLSDSNAFHIFFNDKGLLCK